VAVILASKKAKVAWEIGVPLRDAWLRFAPPDLAAEYGQAPGFLDSLDSNAKPATIAEFFKPISDGLTKSLYRTELENRMKEHLLTDLFNGQLIAAGYREFPSISQSPVIIDPEKFNNDDPDWSNQSLAAHGICYGRIKIADPSMLATKRFSKPQSGSIAAIENAIIHLAKANSDFADLPRKTSCDMVRKLLGAESKSGNGLSDKNISKAIVRLCGNKKIRLNSN